MSTLAALEVLNTSLQVAQLVSSTIKSAQLAQREVTDEELLSFHNAAVAAAKDTLDLIAKVEAEDKAAG